MYKRYLEPRSLLNDTDFLQGEFVSTLLESIGIDQGYVFSDLITNKFFLPGQLGTLDLMIPGVVDVRGKFLRLKNLTKNFLFGSCFQYFISKERATKRSDKTRGLLIPTGIL